MPGRRDREVALLGRVELLRLAIVHDRAHEGGGLLDRQGPLALGTDFAVDLDGGGKARGNEEIRGLFLGHPPQQVLHQLDSLIAIH